MQMIKLTGAEGHGNKEFWVRPSNIIDIVAYANGTTVVNTHRAPLYVKETPEEIVALLVRVERASGPGWGE